MYIRVIHEKSNVKCLTSSSLILFILVIKYTMQNFSNFEKRLEGATGVLNFVHKVNRIFWSFLFRGPNMMMINLNVAKKLLDMCVLMLQNQWKKKKQKNLSQFWENHNLVNFPSIDAKQFMEQPKQSSFHLGQFISYVTEWFPGWKTSPVWKVASVFHTIADDIGQRIGYCEDASGLTGRTLYCCYFWSLQSAV